MLRERHIVAAHLATAVDCVRRTQAARRTSRSAFLLRFRIVVDLQTFKVKAHELTIAVIVVLVALGGFLLQPNERILLFEGAGIILLFLSLVVGLIAWSRPKHLVYGETGYRAETKLSLGTEKEQIGEVELANLPGESNPSSLDLLKKEA